MFGDYVGRGSTEYILINQLMAQVATVARTIALQVGHHSAAAAARQQLCCQPCLGSDRCSLPLTNARVVGVAVVARVLVGRHRLARG
jgi:hypothetical protein